MSTILIVYYSRKGENYWNGSIRNLQKGNTAVVAEMIREATGGDLFEVETVKTYPLITLSVRRKLSLSFAMVSARSLKSI
jgi:flavodoxin